jgi:hypothetical protein
MWKKQLFDTESRIRVMDERYRQSIEREVWRNQCLQTALNAAHAALTEVLTAAVVEDAHTIASNGIAVMTRALEAPRPTPTPEHAADALTARLASS